MNNNCTRVQISCTISNSSLKKNYLTLNNINFTIRKAVVKDADTLVRLHQKLMRFHSEIDKKFFNWDYMQNLSYYKFHIETILSSDESAVFIAEINNEVIAYMACEIDILHKHWMYNELKCCILLDGYVKEAYRAIGIGSALINETVNFAKAHDADFMQGYMVSKNLKIQSLLSNNGFTEFSKFMHLILK